MTTRQPPAPRVIRARRLALWSLPIVALLVAFAVKVVLVEYHYARGAAAYASKDHDTAREHFEANLSPNLWQRWIAPFNVGDARYGAKDYDGAIAAFDQALTTVPTEHECTVRINLATVYETQGDALLSSGEEDGARGRWQVARKTLQDGNCPTDAGQGQQQSEEAQEQDQRLADKLGEQDNPTSTPSQSQSPTPSGDGSATPTPSADPDQQQLDQLDQLNEEGQQDRKDSEDLQERDPNPNWGYHW